MEFIRRNIPKTNRNGVINAYYSSSSTNVDASGKQALAQLYKWFYEDAEGNLHTSYNFVGDQEVCAYGVGDSTGGGGIATEVIDNLTSTSTTAALSANQGRVLKELIDGIDISDIDNISFTKITDKPTTISGYGITDAYTKTQVDGLIDDVKDGNVYSATRLQTTRYIWSQPFNGTDDVEGDLDNCTSIRIADTPRTAAETATLSSSPMFRITNNTNNYGMYMWVTGADGAGHIQAGREDSTTLYYNIYLQELGGNVGIGTKSPSYKLDVNGTTRTTTLNVNGQSVTSTDVSEWKDLADVLSIDSSGNLKCNTNFYSTGEVAAYGEGNTSGGGGTTYQHFTVSENSGQMNDDIRVAVRTAATNPYIGFYHNNLNWYAQAYNGKMWMGNGTSTSMSIDQYGDVVIQGDLTVNGTINGDTGSDIDIIDNVTSVRTDAALSANQGRLLSQAIVNVASTLGNNYYNKTQVDDLIDSIDTGGGTTYEHFDVGETSGLNSDTRVFIRTASSNPYIGFYHSNTNWYVQAYNNRLYLGPGSSVSPYVTAAGSIFCQNTLRIFGNTLSSSATAYLDDAPRFKITNSTSDYGMYMWITGDGNGHIQTGREDNNSTMYNLCLQEMGGTVGIGLNKPSTSYKLDVSGSIRATGSVVENSDIRYKSNIQKLENRGCLNPVTFIKDGKEDIGFIAQEVKEIYPEIVSDDGTEEHYLSINYSRVTAILQAQIIEQQTTIDNMQKQIDELKELVNNLIKNN